jgi:signal peptidase I
VPAGAVGSIVRGFTGPWTSSNGLSWMRLFILFLIVRWGLITVYSIPTPSMEPTLAGDENWLARDRVAVNKLAFGPRYPFTDQRIVRTGAPKRWDIVVFDSPAPSHEGDVLIKRVVGLPGESIRISQGRLLINNEEIEPPAGLADAIGYTEGLMASPETVSRLLLHFAKKRAVPRDLPREPAEAYQQLRAGLDGLHSDVAELDLRKVTAVRAIQLARRVGPDGQGLVTRWWESQVYRLGPSRFGVIKGPEFSVIPEGYYYCLGDNGPESFDSRMFGWVPHENLIGRAFAIVTPPGRASDLSGFTTQPRGRLIIIGTLALLFLWELIPGFVVFSTRVRGSNASMGLQRGDRVIIDRIAYGPRIPFSTRRLFWWRRPREGEAVCFRMSRTGARDVYIGRVLAIAPRPMRIVVTGPPRAGSDSARYILAPSDVLGLARAVWWPRRRRQRIRRASAKVESLSAVDLD